MVRERELGKYVYVYERERERGEKFCFVQYNLRVISYDSDGKLI